MVQAARLAVVQGNSQLVVKQWVESVAAETFAGLHCSDDCHAALDMASGVVDMDTSSSPAWLLLMAVGSSRCAGRALCVWKSHKPRFLLYTKHWRRFLVRHVAGRWC